MKRLRFELFGRLPIAAVIALMLLTVSVSRLPAQAPLGLPPPPDVDRDGLEDPWEITQAALGLSPRKANLILVPVIRPNMTREEVQPTLDRVVEFFARVPNRNPDGTIGIGVIIQWGNVLPDTDKESEYPCCS